jgi:hypothetical protein
LQVIGTLACHSYGVGHTVVALRSVVREALEHDADLINLQIVNLQLWGEVEAKGLVGRLEELLGGRQVRQALLNRVLHLFELLVPDVRGVDVQVLALLPEAVERRVVVRELPLATLDPLLQTPELRLVVGMKDLNHVPDVVQLATDIGVVHSGRREESPCHSPFCAAIPWRG